MGRPLKTAKAQAVLTITATTSTTNVVTVSESLSAKGVIAGMSFIPATTVGGLTGGTTYWILKVLSDTTFLASATTVYSNPTYTPVTLTTTTGQSVAATVGLVGSGFNNPDGSANTYGVVGGNTAYFGNQILANVAIGRNGTGTIYSFDDSTTIGGIGTDFANISANSSIEVNGVVIGRVATATGDVTVEITDTVDDGTIVLTSADNVANGLPILVEANVGGLIEGTYYLVTSVDTGAEEITVTNLDGSSVTLANTTGQSVNAVQNISVLAANATATLSGAEFVYATPEAGYIVRQKGKTKYLVTGSSSGVTAPCYTANVANAALTSNTFSVIGTYANTNTVNMRSLSNYSSEVFYDTNDANADPDIHATFNSAKAANVADGILNPVVTINKA